MAQQGSSSIIVEELAGERRAVRLVGSGQPFRPAAVHVLQQVVTTWYNGNPEASQQVLGPQDPPVDWEGYWRRTLLGRTPAVVTQDGADTLVVAPYQLYELFDDVCRKGRRLRVTWAALDGAGVDRGKLVREGRLRSFDASFDRVDDIGWKATFEWLGRSETAQRVINQFNREGDIAAAINDAQVRANALASYAGFQRSAASNAHLPGSASAITLGQIESLVDYPNRLLQAATRGAQRVVSQLQQVGQIMRKARNVPYQLANTALALARDAVAVANQFQDEMGRRSPELNSYKMSVQDVMRSTTYLWRGADLAREMAASGHSLRRTVVTPATHRSEQQPRTILGVHVVRPTDTLSSIASKWYGNPDLADTIARANHIPWHTVHPARPTLVIPNPETLKQS